MFLEHREVWHVFNPRMSGRIVSSDQEKTVVAWSDNRVLTHPTRFIVDEFTKRVEGGPGCRAVSHSLPTKGSSRRIKDPAVQGS
jgi:hypothetical protein